MAGSEFKAFDLAERARSRSPRSSTPATPSGTSSVCSEGAPPTYAEVDLAHWKAVAGQKSKQNGLTVYINDTRSLATPTACMQTITGQL